MKLEKIDAPKNMPWSINHAVEIHLGFVIFQLLIFAYAITKLLQGNGWEWIVIPFSLIFILISTWFVISAWRKRIPNRYLWSDDDNHWQMYKYWKNWENYNKEKV